MMIHGSLEGRMASQEVVIRKLLPKFGLYGKDNDMETTMVAKPVAMVETPKIIPQNNVKTTGTSVPKVATPKTTNI